jgi:hypothetical protein
MQHAYKILFRKPQGKRPREKTRLRWENNIKMMDSSGLEQGPVTGCCEHGSKPSGYKKCGDQLLKKDSTFLYYER